MLGKKWCVEKCLKNLCHRHLNANNMAEFADTVGRKRIPEDAVAIKRNGGFQKMK